MLVLKRKFIDFIEEEVEIWEAKNFDNLIDHAFDNFLEGPKANILLAELLQEQRIVLIYKTEARLRNLINKAFFRYIAGLFVIEQKGYQYQLANRIFHIWYKEILQEEYQNVCMAALLNFEVSRKIIIGGFEILPFDKRGGLLENELNFYKLLGFTKVKKIKFFQNEFTEANSTYFLGGNVIRIIQHITKSESFYEGAAFYAPDYLENRNKMTIFISLLRIFKRGDMKMGNYYSAVTSMFFPQGLYIHGGEKYSNGYQYPLVDKKEIRRLREFYNRHYIALSDNSLPNQIKIGLEYFNSSFDKKEMHEKLIDLMIALDAFLGVSHEATYRLMLRVSCFVSKAKKERIEIYENIEKVLELRGKLLHGKISPADPKYKGEIERFKYYIEDINRKIIIKLLEMRKKGILESSYTNKIEIEHII